MTQTTNNVTNLLMVADELPDGELRNWYLDSVGKFMKGSPMDTAFGLKTKQGSRSPQIMYRYWLRNGYLRDAYSLCPGNGITLKVIKLVNRIEDFEKTIYPSCQDLVDPPCDFSDISQALFYAFKLGLPLPGKDQLYDIISKRRS